MAKIKHHVLIIEDDISQGKALFEAFGRAGFKASLCSSGSEALTQAERTEFELLVVDCFLPKINGIDIAEQIVNKMSRKPVVIFVSGVFKGRSSITEAIKRIQTDASFFAKPVDLHELMNHAQRALEERDDQSSPLLKLYSSRPLEESGIAGLVASQPTIHAYHLPRLLHKLMHAQAEGELTVSPDSGEPSRIRFHQGRIFLIDPPDRDTYFGRLAVRNSFAEPSDVSEALKKSKDKTLGQNLIDALVLSPHAVRLIVTEQLERRLDRTIRDEVVALNWVDQRYPEPEITLTPDRLETLIDVWTRSKIGIGWMRSTLILWSAFKIEGDHESSAHSIESVFTSPGFDIESAIPDMFRALMKGRAHLAERAYGSVDYSVFESRLDQLAAEFESADYYQILGLKDSVHMYEINKAIRHLEDSFDPAHLPADCPASLVKKCKGVFVQIEQIRNTLSNDRERERYLRELKGARMHQRLEAEQQFKLAVQNLLNGRHFEAATSLQHLIDERQAFKHLHSYWLWASIKCNRNPGRKGFDQVPLEERDSAEYMIAKGIYFRAKGRFKEAIACLRKAHQLNPNLKMANLEFQSLISELDEDRLRRAAG